jgi:hypothetical protein
MLHDMFHFVPVDPHIGAANLDNHHKATYIAHRLLSEASTLVLADMVAIADARLGNSDYDVSKRKIFPVYQSITENNTNVSADKLLAANAYFCFTGDPTGFKMLGASEEAILSYRQKYEKIFRDDFMWNLRNLEEMISEKSSNPRVAEYYQWLEENTDFPVLTEYAEMTAAEAGGIDIPTMLSLFRAQYKNALGYQDPIDDVKHSKYAMRKYLAGQRIVFARFGEVLDPVTFLADFDANYDAVVSASDSELLTQSLENANRQVDDYLGILSDMGHLLPHEYALYRFSAPLYPIRFVNYERKGTEFNVQLAAEIDGFVNANRSQLGRLLDVVAA